MAGPVRFARLVALMVVLLAGIGIALAVPVLSAAGRARAVRGWFRAILRASGVRLHPTDRDASTDRNASTARDASTARYASTGRDRAGRGALSAGGATLVTANHVSWLDIPAVLAMEPMRVLAKSDVRGWPIIGLLAAKSGTLFIDRRRLRRLPVTVADLAGALHSGDSVLVFPEGTTWCGRTHGRFYPAAFQAAINAGVPVRPVSLRYRLADGTSNTAAAFLGDDTLLASVWRVVSTRGLTVDVTAGPVVSAGGRTRRDLAADVSARVRTALPYPIGPVAAGSVTVGPVGASAVGQPGASRSAAPVPSGHGGRIHH